MLVKELIQLLQTMPQDKDIWIERLWDNRDPEVYSGLLRRCYEDTTLVILVYD